MDYSDYSFSATTQAEFYRAEAEMLRFGERLRRRPYAEYMKKALMAIDAIFAVRMSHDAVLPVVPLITAFDLTDWKHHGDTEKSARTRRSEFRFPDEQLDLATEALHYMQALEWVAETSKPGYIVTIDTV